MPEKAPRSDEDLVGAVVRMIRSLGVRAAESDPDFAQLLKLIGEELDAAIRDAVAGWRSHGFSDSQIGRELGVTKQAVQQRWPRQHRPTPTPGGPSHDDRDTDPGGRDQASRDAGAPPHVPG